jgi:hypothetical protein
MRALLASGIGLLVLAGPAVAWGAAQMDSQPSSRSQVELAQVQMPQSGGGQMQVPPQGGMMMPGVGQGQGGAGGPMGANPEMMQRMHEMMMRHMKQSEEGVKEPEEEEHQHSGRRGTRLRLKRGDAEIDIRCGADDTLRDCVAAVTTLLDKLAPLSGQPSPSH